MKKTAIPEQSPIHETSGVVEGAEKQEEQAKTLEVNKVEEAAMTSVEKAQDFLAGKRSFIDQLKAYEVPLGAASLVFGLLHLIGGSMPLL